MLISCLNGQTDRAKSYEPCRILDFARVVVVLGELHRLEYTRHGILPTATGSPFSMSYSTAPTLTTGLLCFDTAYFSSSWRSEFGLTGEIYMENETASMELRGRILLGRQEGTTADWRQALS